MRYVEPPSYRAAREELRAMTLATREELRASGEVLPPELRCIFEEPDHFTSDELMKCTRQLLAESARYLRDELGIDS